MKIFVNNVNGFRTQVKATGISFTNDKDMIIFSVTPGRDGRSIIVRGVETIFIDGVAFGSRLSVSPEASNLVTIQARPYVESGS